MRAVTGLHNAAGHPYKRVEFRLGQVFGELGIELCQLASGVALAAGRRHGGRGGLGCRCPAGGHILISVRDARAVSQRATVIRTVSSFHAVYFRNAHGAEPVASFIDELAPKARAVIKNQVGRLNLLSDEQPHLPFPHSSQVRGEIRELRCHCGRQHVRILYARSERLLVLLHAFAKTTGRMPEQDIAIAEARLDDFRRRMNSQPRRPPRAAGRDAPG